jgi:uroporphyrinogen decarboxylase
VLPHSQKIFTALREEGIPSIHFGTATAGLLPLMAEAGGDVIGADWRISLEEAWRAIESAAPVESASSAGETRGIQGNLDPIAMMAPLRVLQSKAAEVLDEAAGRPGHIFNLGHGLLPSTPEDAVKALTDFVHEYSAR